MAAVRSRTRKVTPMAEAAAVFVSALYGAQSAATNSPRQHNERQRASLSSERSYHGNSWQGGREGCHRSHNILSSFAGQYLEHGDLPVILIQFWLSLFLAYSFLLLEF
jgi:hypothetical protein